NFTSLHSKRITVYDIAEKAGVSQTTVSLALRNHYRISEKRRRQIRRIADEMGYAPDPFLSTLASYRAQIHPSREQSVIAWINHWEQPERLRGAHREFDAYWRGAQTSAKRFGYKLEEIRWSADHSARRFEQILLTRGIRGVLIPPHHVVPDWGNFDWSKFSIIRFGLSVPSPDSHLVTSDQQRAVIMALKRISDYGYRRIGMTISDRLDQNIGGNYTGGFYAAQKLFKVPGVNSLLETDEEVFRHRPTMMKERLRKWLEKTQPDAVLTADGLVPVFIRELGYRIPKDIAVAGTALDVPVDTGIDQHSEAIGRIAVEALVAQINLNERGEPTDPSRILVESRWRDGTSLPQSRKL
ncbi:MAG: LacI family DNA-binding transcriptional regulator, partial [Limisphaerales bacterium]